MSTIADVRRYWDRRPCNVRHSDAPVGTRRWSDEIEFQKYAVEPHIPGFAQFQRWLGLRVLEIGCGLGTETQCFARGGASVTAVDVSPISLDLARLRPPLEGLGSCVEFVEADAEHLPASVTGPFDLVWSFGALHHTPHPLAALNQARRVVAPDGYLRIMLYHRWSTKALALVCRHPLRALRGFDRAVAVQSEAQTGCPITHTYSRAQARALVEGAGFRVDSVRVTHIFPYAIGPYREHRLVRRWYWRVLPLHLLERWLGWHLLIEAQPNA